MLLHVPSTMYIHNNHDCIDYSHNEIRPVAVLLLVDTVAIGKPCLIVQTKLQLDLIQPQSPTVCSVLPQVLCNLVFHNKNSSLKSNIF